MSIVAGSLLILNIIIAFVIVKTSSPLSLERKITSWIIF